MPEINVFGVSVSAWIVIPVVFLVWITVMMFIKKTVFKIIKKA